MTTTSESSKPVTAYCRTCGKPLTEDTVRVAMGTVFCEEHAPAAASSTSAGAVVRPLPNPGVSPGLAFLLGLIPGVGAIYNGQYAKGVVHALIFGMLISIMASDAHGGLEPLFGLLAAVFYFYMAFEAYHTAKKRQLGEPVDEWSSLIRLQPSQSGLPLGPIILMLLGILFLLNNFGWLRLYQVMKFWPVLLILVGGYQLWLRMKRNNAQPTVPTGVGDELR